MVREYLAAKMLSDLNLSHSYNITMFISKLHKRIFINTKNKDKRTKSVIAYFRNEYKSFTMYISESNIKVSEM